MTDLQQLMQMGQQIQERMTHLNEELEGREVTASSGGGMVTVTADGKGHVRRITIDPTCVDARDVEMLEDLVLAAVSQAQTKAGELYQEEVKKATGGLPMNMPGLQGLL